MSKIPEITRVLTSLDPADQSVSADTDRARADLHHIMTTDPGTPRADAASAPVTDGSPARRHRTTRYVALTGAAAAAVTMMTIGLPGLSGGDSAFATWTAQPEGLTEEQAASAAKDCKEHQADPAFDEYEAELAASRPVVAERRGAWTTVILAGPDGFTAMCITDTTAGLFSDGMIGSIGVPTGYSSPSPRDLIATDLGNGTLGTGDVSLAAGAAGQDVVGLTYDSPTHGEVSATINEGHFALWLPGDEMSNAAGVQVTVTYRDGTTANAQLTL